MLILFDDGIAEQLETDRIDDSTFRLKETPLASATIARRGDVVELADEGKIWRFVRIVSASTHRTIELPVRPDGWTGLREIFEYVEEIGGHWERAFGGIVLLHVPPEHAAEVQRRVTAAERED